MRGMVPNDPQTQVSNYHYAIVYAPRKKRNRFPASCVELQETIEEVVTSAEPDRKRYAAKVHGPSKSSEGQFIYYLIEWL
ncbi:MAG TPA: hypothetical protein ENJ33_05120 [Thiothrix sp.]|nr:hypothetical protein [Thiothrix sp.]